VGGVLRLKKGVLDGQGRTTPLGKAIPPQQGKKVVRSVQGSSIVQGGTRLTRGKRLMRGCSSGKKKKERFFEGSE